MAYRHESCNFRNIPRAPNTPSALNVETMIFRLRDFVVYPRAIKARRDLLSEAESWSAERRRGWVQERLERTLDHAVTNIPYYRRTLAPFRSRFAELIERLDLSPLPILTKETVRNHFDELCADSSERYRPIPVTTSGSTGTPTRFLLDREANVDHFAAIWRVLNWAGYRFGNRFADLTGYIPRRGRLFEYDPRLNCLHLSSFNFKRENIPLYVQRLRRFRPVLLKAYPSSLDLLSRWIREAGLEPYRPKALLTCAESLLDHQRATIEETFGRQLHDFYNQNERAALISTCAAGRYHVHEEYSFLEFLGRPDAGPAQIVATSFHNLAMPLIRYQTNDLAMLDSGSACPCGRGYRTVQRIVGRVEDVVVTPDGRHVGRLDAAFKSSPGIRLSQIVQQTVDRIRVDIVRSEHYAPSDGETLEHELRARLGDRIGIDFNFVDHIPPGRNGKIQFVISAPGRAVVRLPLTDEPTSGPGSEPLPR